MTCDHDSEPTYHHWDGKMGCRLCDLEARLSRAVEALRRLALEARGFVEMADTDAHGRTNIQVMNHWIQEAFTVLASERPQPQEGET